MFLTYVTLAILINVVASQNPSPCPDIFTYEPRGQEQDRWYGVMSLRTKEDLNGVWIRVILDRQVELLGNWFGEATSLDNKEFAIKNPKYRLEAGPPVSIRFFVKYNPASIIPSLTEIRLNGKVICSSERDVITTLRPQLHISQITSSNSGTSNSSNNRPNTGSSNTRPNSSRPSRPSVTSSVTSGGNNDRDTDNFGTSVTSSSSSNQSTNNRQKRPGSSSNKDNRNPNDRGTSNEYENSREDTNTNSGSSISNGLGLPTDSFSGDYDYFQGDLGPVRPQLKPSATRPQVGPIRKHRCGEIARSPSPLISHGQSTVQGQWPWHAALYHTQKTQLTYTCGGTLITEEHVLTAAHCVARPQTDRPINKNHLMVYLGKYNLIKFGPEVQDREVSEIHIHPQYNHSYYYNDIAILKLDKPVEINNYVRTCCLWDEDVNIENIMNKAGTVVGWGFDANRQVSTSLMQAQMPIVSTVQCIYSNRDFFSQFTSENSFCAGFRNGTSVCNGDSGGGMVLPKSGTSGQNIVWQIRGLVSVGVALQGQGVCDTSQYIVFTDVAKYLNWIKRIINL